MEKSEHKLASMGLIKRILRQTSNKLLNKLGAQHSSRRLILNPHSTNSSSSPARLLGRSASIRTKRANKKLARTSASACIPEALLQAAKNYLPPVQFHHVHGPNVKLSANKLIARRTQGFCQALVFSNRVILPNERVYIKVLEIAKGWSGTIRFGFTSVDPATLRYQMPKHACPDMTNAGHTWARALADEVVRRNSVIHLSYNTNGYIHYGINNQDCGIFYANVNTSQHLWFIVDIYGLTAAVELIDPRIHNASRELDFSQIDEDLRLSGQASPSTLLLSKPDAQDSTEQFQAFDYSAVVRLAGKKKRSRKSSRNRLPVVSPSAGLNYEPWLTEAQASLIRNDPMNLNLTHLPTSTPRQAQFLPNLNSIALPSAQQNIYSPMPANQLTDRSANSSSTQNIIDAHDYHQIVTTTLHSSSTTGNQISSALAQRSKILSPPVVSSRAGESETSSNTCRMMAAPARAINVLALKPATTNGHEDELGICHKMNNLHFSSSNTDALKQHNAVHPSKSTSASVCVTTPSATIGASRRYQHHPNNQFRRASADLDSRSKVNSSNKTLDTATVSIKQQSRNSKGTLSLPNNSKIRTKHLSTKAQSTKALMSRDNNSSPSSKDCPICFERPINCVLYQCGHMCTCYECGVKQWKTQSRTCPICRTVIKDVIKTYLS